MLGNDRGLFHWSVIKFILSARHPLSEASRPENGPIEFSTLPNSCRTLQISLLSITSAMSAIQRDECARLDKHSNQHRQLDFATNTGFTFDMILMDHIAIVEASDPLGALALIEVASVSNLAQMTYGDPAMLSALQRSDYMGRLMSWLRGSLSNYEPGANMMLTMMVPRFAHYLTETFVTFFSQPLQKVLAPDLRSQTVKLAVIPTLEELGLYRDVDIVKTLDILLPSLVLPIPDGSPLLVTLHKQLQICSLRMSKHPKADDVMKRAWHKHDWITRLPQTIIFGRIEGPICGAIGCADVTTPTMKCSRCGSRYYCNPKCQRADWKSHKQYCSKKKS
ncbi:hypothetical protein DL93DRAFT_135300 [Clavulina sp. PMI_390]|nr:hypothetical protein DL93DRAFT_135300 [Clavulina sp. PMI_390]